MGKQGLYWGVLCAALAAICALVVLTPAAKDYGSHLPTAQLAQATAETALTAAQGVSTGSGELSPLESLALLQQVLQLQRIPILAEARLPVENISQIPELPNGCEITSAAIVLNYLGIAADKLTLADSYLPTAAPYWAVDPEEAFMGDPHSEYAYYCYTAPVVQAVNDYLADTSDTAYTAQDISGAEVSELEWYLTQGTPVLVWATRGMGEPLYSESFTLPGGEPPFENLHCLVLTGFNAKNVYFADPMNEIATVTTELFAQRYEQLGQRAVVIVPTISNEQ